MKKKVWILNHYACDTFFDHGGRHYALGKYLRRAGYEPVIFCSNTVHGKNTLYFDTDELLHEHMAEDIDVPYVFVRARPYRGNGKQRLLNMWDFYCNCRQAARIYAEKNGKPDVIYASSVHPLTLLAGIQLARRYGVKCICEVRDLWPESLVAYGIAGKAHPAVILLRCLEKWVYKHSDAVVFTMEGAYDYIRDQGWEHDVPCSKVFFINNGVDLEVFDRNRNSYTVDDADLANPEIRSVVYTGSIRKVNGLGSLLDVAKCVKDPSIRFLIWGDGDELEMLKQRLKDEKIENVVFKGRVEKQFIPFITSCAALNYAHNTPSSLFKYGISFNKLFDYMAAGKPVFCDFQYPHNPVIESGSGIDTDGHDYASTASAIESIVHLEPSEYERYSVNARKAAQAYDYSVLTEKFIRLFETL